MTTTAKSDSLAAAPAAAVAVATNGDGQVSVTVAVVENAGGEAAAPSRPAPPRPGDLLGRHRLSSAISRLNQEIQFLEEELRELETMEACSAACSDVISRTAGIPDALLPVTSGPEHASWDRWFQRVRSSNGRRWWTNKSSDFF